MWDQMWDQMWEQLSTGCPEPLDFPRGSGHPYLWPTRLAGTGVTRFKKGGVAMSSFETIATFLALPLAAVSVFEIIEHIRRLRKR